MKRDREHARSQMDRPSHVSSARSAVMCFAEEMDREMTKVDPTKCFSLIIDGEQYRLGIENIYRIFRRLMSDETFCGMSLGVGAALVVSGTKYYRPYLLNFLGVVN